MPPRTSSPQFTIIQCLIAALALGCTGGSQCGLINCAAYYEAVSSTADEDVDGDQDPDYDVAEIDSEVGSSASAKIAATDGGMVAVEGAMLIVPPGALPEDTEVRLTKSDSAVSCGFTPGSALYEVTPAALILNERATLVIDLTPPILEGSQGYVGPAPDPFSASGWSSAPSFALEGGAATVEIETFSYVVVGRSLSNCVDGDEEEGL